MSKREFLSHLRKRLSKLPKREIDERVRFYEEMLNDYIEEGFSEEEAIEKIGAIDEFPVTEPKSHAKRKIGAWEIVLLVLGSPIWLSLLLSAFAVVFSIFAVLWSLLVALWAVFIALAVCAPVCAIGGLVYAFCGYGLTGLSIVGTGMICAGLSIFLFFGCKASVGGVLLLTKKSIHTIKSCFAKKEEI